MITYYLGLYEEGEVEHINGPTHPVPYQLGSLIHRSKVSSVVDIYKESSMYMRCVAHVAHAHVTDSL